MKKNYYSILFYFILYLSFIIGSFFLFEFYANYKWPEDTKKRRYDTSLLSDKENIYITSKYFDNRSRTPHIFGPNKYSGKGEKWVHNYKKNYDIKVNKFGFFTEYPLDNFPSKVNGEFRIILVGGSGAQGWGARTNSHMFYNIVQKKLNAQIDKNSNFKFVRIINLAMAGAHLISIKNILRAYGSELDPNLILFYVGVNDTLAIMEHGSFSYKHEVGKLNFKHSNVIFKTLEKNFPITMNKLGLGETLKAFFGIKNKSISAGFWREQSNTNKVFKNNPKLFFDNYVIKEQIRAIKTIKRDFCGIPISIVRQIWNHPKLVDLELRRDRRLDSIDTEVEVYDYWWEKINSGVENYINHNWQFIDAQDYIWKDLMSTSRGNGKTKISNKSIIKFPIQFNYNGSSLIANKYTFYTHLDNLGHDIFSNYLTSKLLNHINKDYLFKNNFKC